MRFGKFAVTVILFLGSTAFCEDIGALSVGVDNYLGSKMMYNNIAQNSATFGLLAPIKFANVTAHIKIRFAYHHVDASHLDSDNASFLHATNEILFGYKLPQQGKLMMLPQLGIGFSAERYKIDTGIGDANIDMLLDASFRVEYEMSHFNVGAMLNFERDFSLGIGSFLSPNRLNLALIISK